MDERFELELNGECASGIGTVGNSKIWFSNHRLKMTRALSDQVLRDFRSKEHRYFEACKDYDDCDGHTRGSSRIGVGSIVLIHVPQPVGQGGKLYKRMEGI